MSIYRGASGNVAWRIASTCDAGTCVGVARQGEFVVIGNTSNPDGPVSEFSVAEWKAFLAGAKLGDFDDLALSAIKPKGRRITSALRFL